MLLLVNVGTTGNTAKPAKPFDNWGIDLRSVVMRSTARLRRWISGQLQLATQGASHL
jgi:hypothetical protein